MVVGVADALQTVGLATFTKGPWVIKSLAQMETLRQNSDVSDSDTSEFDLTFGFCSQPHFRE